MAVTTPNWLTTDFLKSFLESNKEQFQEIILINYKVESAIPPGNNYGSQMFRVKLNVGKQSNDLKEDSISIIIKAPLSNRLAEEMSYILKDVCERESKFYNEYISETYTLCKHEIVPKHYKSPNPNYLVLEDLCSSGHIMVDRHKLLDFEHCKLYTKASARLHAMSIAAHKKNPQLIESLTKESPMSIEKGEELSKGLLIQGLQCMAAYLEEKPKYKEYLDFINKANENCSLWSIVQEMEKSTRPLRALIQADPWCTNMMFKYNSNGEVISIKLLDFQNLKLTSPVRELITFLWVSPSPEVREAKLHELYHLYRDSLNGCLAELECSERLSLEDMNEEIAFLSPLIILVVFVMLPFCIADEVVDMESFLMVDISNLPVKEYPLYKLYQGTNFKQCFPKILDQVTKEGVLENLINRINLLK